MTSKIKKTLRRFFKNKSKYYSYSYYRDSSFFMYNNIESLCYLFKTKNEIIKTEKTIFLHTNTPFGSNLKSIKRKLGKPSCYIKKSINSLCFDILFYKMYLGGYKTKHEVHFYKNKLYYFSYVFSYLNESDKKFLKKIVCKKYLKQECELNNITIIDKYGNSIFISENVDFTINYITGDSEIRKEFKSIHENTLNDRKKLHEKNQVELLNKL